MARYVDGFVIPIKISNRDQYKKMAVLGKKLWMEHGALDYYECIADDFAEWGLTFPKMCKLKPDETVLFSFIIFKSKAHRDKVNAKVYADPRMKMDPKTMPFDMKRFAMAGFKTLVTN